MPKILAVDDDEPYLATLSDLLKADGYEVETCSNPREVQKVLENGPFHCVILDYFMAGLDGQDLLRLIQTKYPNLPVIICSGYLEPQQLEELKQEGAGAVFQKPFEHEALRSTINKLMAASSDDDTMSIIIKGYNFKTVRDTVFRKLIIKALTKSKFNATHAAKLLGISRQSLLRYTKRYQINY